MRKILEISNGCDLIILDAGIFITGESNIKRNGITITITMNYLARIQFALTPQRQAGPNNKIFTVTLLDFYVVRGKPELDATFWYFR